MDWYKIITHRKDGAIDIFAVSHRTQAISHFDAMMSWREMEDFWSLPKGSGHPRMVNAPKYWVAPLNTAVYVMHESESPV